MSIESAYQYLYLSAAIVLAVLVGIVLIRSVIGPRITDRILWRCARRKAIWWIFP